MRTKEKGLRDAADQARSAAAAGLWQNGGIAMAACGVALLISLGGLGYKAYVGQRERESIQTLRTALGAELPIVMRLAAAPTAETGGTAAASEEHTLVHTAAEAETLAAYAKLWQRNTDMIGWIRIDGTKLDYPVMQSVGRQHYYIDHNFEKKRSKSGLPFAEETCILGGSPANLLIYGHNMKDGSMFAALHGYLDPAFLEAHRYITFDTMKRTGRYEVVCVYETVINPSAAFKFYHYSNIDNEAAMEAYAQGLAERSILDEPPAIQWGDELITLVTCSKHADDGRLVVVAKRV